MVATVSINTLTASGYYLSAIENGEPPPKGEILIYRRGQNLQLGEVEGRVEFARIMLGLLGKVCTRKETPDQEPEEDTPEEKPIQVKSENGSTWEKVMKKSRFSISLRSSTSSPRGRDAGDKNVPAAPIAPLEVSSEA